MNRIGIFCYYDKEGIVDRYIEFLLEDLCQCLSSLIIVINGYVKTEDKLILQKYADEIYVRDNIGYDGGAYRDVLINILGWSRVQKYDELILCNDTFYGPFVPFQSIFNEMENKNVDFWGLNYYYNKIINHLQSYFLVFRKKIINGNDMMNYMEKNINSSMNNITDIYGEFEVGLFHYLVNQGYTYASYSNTPYRIYEYQNFCIKESNLPILKKKSFSPEYFILNNIMDTLKYLNGKYELDLILNNIKRIYGVNITKRDIEMFYPGNVEIIKKRIDIARISDMDIKNLVLNKKIIFIFGLGIYSGIVSKIINNFQGQIAGYIISDGQDNIPKYKHGIRVYKVSEIENRKNMVIIVALNKEHTQDVSPYLDKFGEVIYLW